MASERNENAVVVEKVSTARISELDGLRGLAIALVLAWHSSSALFTQAPESLRYVVSSAGRFLWSGVDLFFVLSGFLIGGILLDQRTSPRYFSTFYGRRFFRIVPLYAVMLLLFAIARRVFAGDPNQAWLLGSPMPLPTYATFTQNFAMAWKDSFGAQWLGPTWSLAVEEQFYLVLPLMVRLVPPRWLRGIVIAVLVAAPLLRVTLLATMARPALAMYTLMPSRADALMAGVLLAIVIRDPEWFAILQQRRRALWIFLCVVILSLGVLAAAHQGAFSMGTLTIGLTILATTYALLLLLGLVSPEEHWWRRLLRARWLRRLGTLAYGLYLLSVPVDGVCGWIFGRWFSPPLVALIALVSAYLLAEVSWRFLERPMLRKGHRLSY